LIFSSMTTGQPNFSNKSLMSPNLELRVKNLIQSEVQKNSSTNKSELKNNNSIIDYFRSPKILFGFGTVILVLLSLLIFERPSYDKLLKAQSGEDNMFVQAGNNFASILQGKLRVQFSSNKPTDLKEYFQKSGVTYNTCVPEFSQWELVGGVVSENHGEKFAHHVYQKNGTVLYLYQVDIKCFRDGQLALSDSLLEEIHKGNIVNTNIKGNNAFVWEYEEKTFILFTNETEEKIKDNFLVYFRK